MTGGASHLRESDAVMRFLGFDGSLHTISKVVWIEHDELDLMLIGVAPYAHEGAGQPAAFLYGERQIGAVTGGDAVMPLSHNHVLARCHDRAVLCLDAVL